MKLSLFFLVLACAGLALIEPLHADDLGADYGLTVLPTRNERAAALALFVLSQEGQKILSRNGFDAPLFSPGPQ